VTHPQLSEATSSLSDLQTEHERVVKDNVELRKLLLELKSTIAMLNDTPSEQGSRSDRGRESRRRPRSASASRSPHSHGRHGRWCVACNPDMVVEGPMPLTPSRRPKSASSPHRVATPTMPRLPQLLDRVAPHHQLTAPRQYVQLLHRGSRRTHSELAPTPTPEPPVVAATPPPGPRGTRGDSPLRSTGAAVVSPALRRHVPGMRVAEVDDDMLDSAVGIVADSSLLRAEKLWSLT
jgi:hypothetical protein